MVSGIVEVGICIYLVDRSSLSPCMPCLFSGLIIGFLYSNMSANNGTVQPPIRDTGNHGENPVALYVEDADDDFNMDDYIDEYMDEEMVEAATQAEAMANNPPASEISNAKHIEEQLEGHLEMFEDESGFDNIDNARNNGTDQGEEVVIVGPNTEPPKQDGVQLKDVPEAFSKSRSTYRIVEGDPEKPKPGEKREMLKQFGAKGTIGFEE